MTVGTEEQDDLIHFKSATLTGMKNNHGEGPLCEIDIPLLANIHLYALVSAPRLAARSR